MSSEAPEPTTSHDAPPAAPKPKRARKKSASKAGAEPAAAAAGESPPVAAAGGPAAPPAKARRPKRAPTPDAQPPPDPGTGDAPQPSVEAPPPEEPLTDLQRRAILAEQDLVRDEGHLTKEDLEKVQEEIDGLEGNEGLQQLERAREELNQAAEDHRTERDKLNGRTKQLAEKRDLLNAEVAKRVAEASAFREQRNKLNEEVKAVKVLRDQANQKANELGEAASRLKRERHHETAVPVPRLREEKRALEFRFQTQALTPAKEKEVVAELKRLEKEIKAAEGLMEADKEVYSAVSEARKAKQEAEDQHHRLSEIARQAQAAHEAMMRLYDEADARRAEADAAQQEFIANKKLADQEHFMHIEYIKKIRDYDKVVSGIRRRRRALRRVEADQRQEKRTDTVMEKFKKGEKLSTEDLLALQLRGD